tara:strand:- start:4888 stop:6228 length:1341 start_codon:yes stop_codon:yes gene_type:complete
MDRLGNILLIGLAFIIIVCCCLGTTSMKEGLTGDANLAHDAGSFDSSSSNTVPNLTSQNIHKDPINTEIYRANSDPASSPNSGTRTNSSTNTNSMFADESTLGKMDPETYMSYVRAGKIKFDPSKLPEGMKSCPDGSEPNEYGFCNPNWEEHSNPKSSDYKTKYECELHGYNWDSSSFKCLTSESSNNTSHNKEDKNKTHHSDKKKSLNPSEYTDKDSCTQAEYLWSPTLQVCLDSHDYNEIQNKKKHCAKKNKTIDMYGKCIDCPDNKRWSHRKKKCVSEDKDSENENSSDSDSDSDNEGWFSKMMHKGEKAWNNAKRNELGYDPYVFEKVYKSNERPTGTYHPSAVVFKSQIPRGQEDQYVLKSQIVPPVCPACPPVLAGGGCPAACKAKCAPCPRPPPIQPCPPCARCPEPDFQCKKVPNYGTRDIPGALPMPRLNSFSQFGQ